MLSNCNFYFRGDPMNVISEPMNMDNCTIDKIIQMPSGDYNILSVLKFNDDFHILLDSNNNDRCV